jgi:hypothetical protein
MTPPTRPLAPRVDDLEVAVAELKKSTASLRRDQTATRRLVRELGKRVDQILPTVKTELEAQTTAIETHVSKSSDDVKLFVMSVARQTPAWALVTLTFLITIAATVVANWILAAENLPHIH